MENKTKLIRQQTWSDLPQDILLLISSKLTSSFFDMLSFKEVCSSWRSSMSNRTRMPYPMLVLLSKSKKNLVEKSGHCIDDLYLLNITEKRQYKFKKTPWFVEQCTNAHSIIGSHRDGWLILLNRYMLAYICHLFLEIRIELPNKMLGTTGSLIELNNYNIRKAIVCDIEKNGCKDLVVIMSYFYRSKDHQLALWRQGDCNWSCFRDVPFVFDIAFCNNTIYALTQCPQRGQKYLESWDLKDNLSFPERKLRIQLLGDSIPADRLVVSSAYEILLMNLNIRPNLLICKLDSSKNHRIELNSLNGQSMLSCSGDSVMLSVNDVEHLGYKGNSIYFVRTQSFQVLGSTPEVEFGIVGIEDSRQRLIWDLTGTCLPFIDAKIPPHPAYFSIVLTI